MINCVVRLRTSLLMLILPCICPIFFLFIFRKMKFFVKDCCKTVQARVVMFDKQVNNDVLYRRIASQPSHAYCFPVFVRFCFHILNNEYLNPHFEKVGGILIYKLYNCL